jgi:hypothetical protein
MLNIPDPVGINALEAHVAVSGSAHLVDVSTDGSVFVLWPESPAVVDDAATFAGGTPGSVSGSMLRAVTLGIAATGVGKVTVTVSAATVYVADGQGTPVPLKDSQIFFVVGSKTPLPNTINVFVGVGIALLILVVIGYLYLRKKRP